ncbi:MAG: glycosyltransferase family 87 protein [Phototrophicaceae bacterium]
MPTQVRLQIGFILGIVALLTANVIATHSLFTAPHPGMNDFLSRWEGARTYWQDHASPYSAEATTNIQMMIYGRAALPDDDQGLFAYPFYTVFVLWPLTYLPYAWASAVWMVVAEVCLIAALILLLNILAWRPPLLMQVGLVVFSLFNYYAFRGLILGQMSHFVWLMTALTLWGLAKRQDRLAGVALALTTIKPQMAFLMIPFLVLWALRYQRWKFLISSALAFGALMGLSFILQPDWLGAWIEQVRLYPTYTRDGSPVWILFEVLLGWSPTVGYIVRGIAVVGMLWAWFAVIGQRRDDLFLWAFMVTLWVTHAVGPRTATPHFVVFTPVLLLTVRGLLRQRRGLWAWGLLLIVVIVPWWHFLSTIEPPNLENLTVFLPPIAAVLLALVVQRKDWARLPSPFGGAP